VARSTVYSVAERFRAAGEFGLLDRREDNGEFKLDEEGYLARLHTVVQSHPEEFGWKRPTWAREMLVATMRQQTGVKVHVGTMSRGACAASCGGEPARPPNAICERPLDGTVPCVAELRTVI